MTSGVKNFRAFGWQKIREKKIYFYYIFLYHDVSRNITQKLMKNKLTH